MGSAGKGGIVHHYQHHKFSTLVDSPWKSARNTVPEDRKRE